MSSGGRNGATTSSSATVAAGPSRIPTASIYSSSSNGEGGGGHSRKGSGSGLLVSGARASLLIGSGGGSHSSTGAGGVGAEYQQLSPTVLDQDAPARRTVLLLLFLSNLVVFTLVQLLAPFFPQLAKDKYHATPFLTGVIFAAAPLAQVISCPISSVLCQRVGRIAVLLWGFLLQASGCALFGLADSIGTFIGARAIQGAGGASILVAGLAIIMDFSFDVEADVARQEVAAGIGAMLGPALGGLLSTYLGLRTLFLAAAVIPISIAVVLLLTLRFSTLGRYLLAMGGGGGATTATTAVNRGGDSSSGSRGAGDVEGQQGGGRGGASPALSLSSSLSVWHVLNPTTVWCGLAIFASSSAMNFWDPIMAEHLSAVLGTDAPQTGAVLTTVSLSYILCCSLLVKGLSERLGNKPTILLGSLLNGLSYIALGPAPLLLLASSSSLLLPRPFAWALTLSCLAAAGVAESLIIVPAAPLMLSSVSHLRALGGDPSDPLAAIFQQCWSAGEFAGPIAGGLLAQVLPKTREMACNGGEDLCSSTFPWTSCCFGVLGLLVTGGFAWGVPAQVMREEERRRRRREESDSSSSRRQKRRRRRKRRWSSQQWGRQEGGEEEEGGGLHEGLLDGEEEEDDGGGDGQGGGEGFWHEEEEEEEEEKTPLAAIISTSATTGERE